VVVGGGTHVKLNKKIYLLCLEGLNAECWILDSGCNKSSLGGFLSLFCRDEVGSWNLEDWNMDLEAGLLLLWKI
jgi:hypothetical protein